MSATTYSVRFTNNSPNTGTVCLFQTVPHTKMSSLAWMGFSSAPGTTFLFQWSIAYLWAWGMGTVAASKVLTASQSCGADPDGKNHVTLSCATGACAFNEPTAHPGSRTLVVNTDATVPRTAWLGFGMDTGPTLVAQAQPNWSWSMAPDPSYWIVFGDYTVGEVLDLDLIPNFNDQRVQVGGTSEAARLTFPTGLTARTATLNADNTWTIE